MILTEATSPTAADPPELVGQQLVEITDDATRREFLAMVAAAGLLAACGNDGAGDDNRSAGDTRSVQDVFGAVSVPVDPQRVVAMDQQVLGNLLRIGFPAERIVGFARGTTPMSGYDFLAPLADLSTFADVGQYADPNAEAIAAAHPDLILVVAEAGNDDFYGPILDALRDTGVPVFAAFNGFATLDGSMRLLADVGRAVGREAAAADAEAELRGAIADLRRRITDAGPVPSAALLRVHPSGTYYNSIVPLFDELGLGGERPTPQEAFVELSAEQLGRFDHDALFVSDGGDEDQTRAALEANPLWARLPAVEHGRIVFVPDTLWGASYSVPALEAKLTDIEAALLP